jgi:hypothetical protein
MAAPNTSPRFTKVAKIGFVGVTAANVKSDGAGTIATDMFLAFTADAVNGSFVERLQWAPTSSTAANFTNATTARVFFSTLGAGAVTSATTVLIRETSLQAWTIDHSTQGIPPFDVPLGFAMPPGTFLLVTNHVAPAANSVWRAVVYGGDY